MGKSVAAQVSAGAKVPLTEIGGQLTREGRQLDQQRLQSAYDYARKAIETAQISDTTALVKEFRSSDAYQWAQGSRMGSTSGFDSSYREAVDSLSTSDIAYNRAKELARAAQFVREWSSGAQTDFTNYAARRLSERGLPIHGREQPEAKARPGARRALESRGARPRDNEEPDARDKLARDQGALYAVGRIVIIVPHNSPLKADGSLGDLRAALAVGRVTRFAIANPEHAP